MLQLKNKISSEKLYLLLIFVVSLLSVGRILHYYFFYDDFFLFYAMQFPNDINSILRSPDASAYLFIRPFFGSLFSIFGYEPTGYFIISFLLLLTFILMFYFFVKQFSMGNSTLAFFSSLIIASGYIGVEALTWNMGAGPNTTIFLTLSFLSLLFTLLYLDAKRIVFLFGITFSFTFAAYFFQFRSFLLYGWMLLLIFIYFFRKWSLPKFFILFLLLLMIVGLTFYKNSFDFNGSQGIHIKFDLLKFLLIYIRNIGNLFFPAELFKFIGEKINLSIDKIEFYAGLVSLLFLLITPLWAFFKKLPESLVLLFFSISTISSLLLLLIVIGLTINAPDVWYSSHRFYFVILPFIAGFLGTILIILKKRFNSIAVFLLIFWVITHIILSNMAILARWSNPISHIQLFYKTIKGYIPKLDKDDVLLIEQGEPTPVSIFVSARAANAYAGLAGFYGLRVDQLNLARSPEEAVKMLNRLGLSENHLYTLFYKRGELINLTKQTRNLLKIGKKVVLGTKSGHVIEFTDLSLPASAPMYANLHLQVIPDFSQLGLLKKIDQTDIENSKAYFPLIIEQEKMRKNMRVESSNEPLSSEHEISNIIDGDYATTWIPLKWDKDGVSITVNLGQKENINKVVWSSSRTASWYVRMPSQYKIEVSLDGKNFTEVHSVEDAPVLKTGQFFIDEFNEQEVKFVKITITKTRGGLLPAIDEVEVFNKNSNDLNLNAYFTIKQHPERYFPDVLTAQRYLSEVLGNNISIEFDWRVDGNTEYPNGQSINLLQEIGIRKFVKILLPISGQEVKSLRVIPTNFPAKIYIEDLQIIYPSFTDLVELK